MSKSEPCTWSMSAAQLITPTSSQLATINAIEALVNASTHWRIVSTGTTGDGKKYLEVGPVITSAYKDMRVVFLETALNNSGKATFDNGTFTGRLCWMICPDGGASYCTFTPARLNTASSPYAPIYAGTKYSSGGNDLWSSMDSPYTAVWMYECDGLMWLVNRNSASTCSIHGIGQVFIHGRADWQDFNEAGTEIGLMGLYTLRGATTAVFTGGTAMFSTSTSGGTRGLAFWTRTSSSATAVFRNQGNGTTPNRAWGMTNPTYEATLGTAAFMPVACAGSTTIGGVVFRGFFTAATFKTRTTIKDSTGQNDLGFSFYCDDINGGYAACFMNVP